MADRESHSIIGRHIYLPPVFFSSRLHTGNRLSIGVSGLYATSGLIMSISCGSFGKPLIPLTRYLPSLLTSVTCTGTQQLTLLLRPSHGRDRERCICKTGRSVIWRTMPQKRIFCNVNKERTHISAAHSRTVLLFRWQKSYPGRIRIFARHRSR